jgi:bifunctional oligoribonuclease and PAP phosphatase NrnA
MMKLKGAPPKAAAGKKSDSLRDVARLIHSHRSFLITTHVNPDGDGLGAQAALYLALKRMGKKVAILNHDPLPPRFSYLASTPFYRFGDAPPEHEVCFVLDAGDFSRLREGVRREEFGTLVNIDHHYSNDLYGDYNLVDPRAAATGEIVYRLLKALKVRIDKGIAEGVYTSIVTDTGRFRYSNTNASLFRLAAELEEAGADISDVSEHIFGDISRQAMELTRLALGTVRTHNGGAIATMTLTQSDFLKSGATDDDTENLINVVRNLDTVRIAVFLKERTDRRIKLSLRSKSGLNVAEVARKFQGGGHAYAAGALLEGPMDKALKSVLEACREALK